MIFQRRDRQQDLARLQVITDVQPLRNTAEAHTVQQGAVSAAEVADYPAGIRGHNLGMPPADRGVIEDHVAARQAADAEALVGAPGTAVTIAAALQDDVRPHVGSRWKRSLNPGSPGALRTVILVHPRPAQAERE